MVVPAALFVPYYVFVALSIASEYEESRWSYSRMQAGAFYLLVQVLVGWIAFAVYRELADASYSAK